MSFRKFILVIIILSINCNLFSQKKINHQIDSIYSVVDICFYDYAFSRIIEFDFNKQKSFDTINSINSSNNIMQYLESYGKIKNAKLDSIHSVNLLYNYNLLCKTLSNIGNPDSVCNVFKNEIYQSTQKRYICFVFQNGYHVTKKKNVNNNLTSFAVGLFTLGMVIPITYKAASNIYFVIIDKK